MSRVPFVSTMLTEGASKVWMLAVHQALGLIEHLHAFLFNPHEEKEALVVNNFSESHS